MIDQNSADSQAHSSPDNKVSAEVKQLIMVAEETRLQKSQQYTARQRAYYIILPLMAALSSSYLIWVLLMGGSFMVAFAGIGASVVIAALITPWAKKPLKDYHKNFKTSFMPAMAKALGNLKFYPTGGISTKLISASGMMPPHTIYSAEDSFRGKFKNIELTITEARMLGKSKKADPAFEGIIVALNTPPNMFKGHTIITSNHEYIKRWSTTRWKKFSPVNVASGIREGDFRVFATNPAEAVSLADMDFMELLHKLSELFGGALISAAFYKGSRVLLMIPCEDNMFEPGDIHMPVANMGYATKCRKEIEQILHVIDVLDVYEPDSSPGSAPAPAPAPAQAPAPITPPAETAPETAPVAASVPPENSETE